MYLGIQIFLVNTEKLERIESNFFFFQTGKPWLRGFGTLSVKIPPRSLIPISSRWKSLSADWRRFHGAIPSVNLLYYEGLSRGSHLLCSFGHYEKLLKCSGLRGNTEWMPFVLGLSTESAGLHQHEYKYSTCRQAGRRARPPAGWGSGCCWSSFTVYSFLRNWPPFLYLFCTLLGFF